MADLSKYQAVINEMRESDMEVDNAMAAIPLLAAIRDHPRFATSARARELDDECHHYAKLESMLQAHKELRDRLVEVTEGEDFDEDELWGPGSSLLDNANSTLGVRPGDSLPADQPPALTATATHRELVGLFQQHSLQSDGLSTLGEATAQEQGSDISQGDAQDASPTLPSTPATLATSRVASDRDPAPGVIGINPEGVNQSSMLEGSQRIQQPTIRPNPSPTPIRNQVPDRMDLPRNSQPRLSVRQPLRSSSRQDARVRFEQVDLASGRRRSQSNDLEAGDARAARVAQLRGRWADELFSREVLTASLQVKIITTLSGIEATSQAILNPVAAAVSWIVAEMDSVQKELDRLEAMETEVWGFTARVRGASAHADRAAAWSRWHQEMCARITALRRTTWDALARMSTSPPENPLPLHIPCRRSGGFLERVRLPDFSGHQEDYSKFKTQFRPCVGVRATLT